MNRRPGEYNIPLGVRTMKIKVTKTYHYNGHELQFIKSKGTPGFSHRVTIDGSKFSWLADTHKPGKKTASFYFEEFEGAL